MSQPGTRRSHLSWTLRGPSLHPRAAGGEPRWDRALRSWLGVGCSSQGQCAQLRAARSFLRK